MNYNIFANPIPNKSSKAPKINKRAKLDTGKECNYNCPFCYYQGRLHEKDSFEEIKERIDKLLELGMEEIDLSGGESSIHENWFEILEYCNSKFKNVSCLSNGSMFKDKKFLEKSKEKGLSEILFSLHGYDEGSHDALVGHKGAFDDMIQSIKNAQDLNVLVRLNCTVTHKNAPHMDRYAKLVNVIKPFQINFLPLNYWDSASKMKLEDYNKLTDGIKLAIDKIFREIEINVRYVPFCFMEGYERYVVGTYQHIYDPLDWNIAAYDFRKFESVEDLFEIAKEKRNYTYFKPKECKDCKFFHICDGIEKQYEKELESGSIKVSPSAGGKIQNVTEFRQI